MRTFWLLVCVLGCGGGGGSGDDTCSAIDTTCGGNACGGDIVGTWTLVTLCAPSCVSSVSDTVVYEADGTYRVGGFVGTWTIDSGSLITTVSGSSSSAAYCVDGDRLWTQRTTNCGTDSGPLTTVRQRACASDVDAGRR
jgi:hypothetical protein